MNIPFVLGLVIIIVAITFVLHRFLFGRLKAMKEEGIRRAEEDLSGKEVKYGEDMANFFGQYSLGATQVRGNGILRITEDEIYFRMLMPSRVFRFPINAESEVDTVKSFLGKTKFVPLMKVTFKNEQGEPDSAAFLVKDLGAAQEAAGQKT